MNPEAQQLAFASRNMYDLIVIYDTRSKTFPSKGAAPTPAGRMREIIYEHEFTKVLPRSPALLVGGYEGWIEFIKSRQAMHMQRFKQEAATTQMPNGHPAPLSPRTTNAPSSPDKRLHREAGVPAHYSKEITENVSWLYKERN